MFDPTSRYYKLDNATVQAGIAAGRGMASTPAPSSRQRLAAARMSFIPA